MENEELVAEIQNGNTALYVDLWEQLQGLIFKIVNGYYALHASSVNAAGQTTEDLCQYGYIAMYNAVQGFENDKGCKFATYLTYHIKSAFAVALGIRSGKRDSLLYAASLDELLDSEDSEGITLGDTVADESAEFESNLIDGLCFAQLHDEIAYIINEMPEPLKSVTALKMQGHSFSNIADRLKLEPCNIIAIDQKAMRYLRSYKCRRRLEAFKESLCDEYSGTSLTAFKNTQSSSIERIAERRELFH